MNNPTGDVTTLLQKIRHGDRAAAEKLVPLVMGELRRLARHYLRSERIGHTLQPTALINEAYLRMGGYERMDWKSRAHFIAIAASVMRKVLIDYARKRRAEKRGGMDHKLPLDEAKQLLSREQSEEVLEVHEALERLEKMNPRHSRVVELRYFGGLSVEETAEALGISPITVKRDWALARAWLRSQIKGKR